jgi:hypothetical protein
MQNIEMFLNLSLNQPTRHYQPFSNKPLSGNATGGKHGSRAIALFGDFYRQRVDLAG